MKRPHLDDLEKRTQKLLKDLFKNIMVDPGLIHKIDPSHEGLLEDVYGYIKDFRGRRPARLFRKLGLISFVIKSAKKIK